MLRVHIDVIAGSGLFDHRWYLDRYPDVRGTEAIAHYLLSGAAEARDPGPTFSTSWYLAAYPDVAAAGLNPLVHYILDGRAEDRPIHAPGRQLSQNLHHEAQLVRNAGLVDVDWYRARYADVTLAPFDPVAHYLAIGWLEGRDPNSRFSTRAYLHAHPELRDGFVSPLIHLLAAEESAKPPLETEQLSIGGSTLGAWTLTSRDRWGAVAAFVAAHRGRSPGVVASGDALPVPFDAHARGMALLLAAVGAPLGGSGAALDDAHYLDPHTFTLTMSGELPIALDAYQFVNGALIRTGASPAAVATPGGWTVALADPLLPLLLVQRDGDGIGRDASVLVFPSLLPGGLHSCEARALRGAASSRTDIGRLLAMRHLDGRDLRIGGLRGDVPPAVAQWFDTVFGDREGPRLELGEGTLPCIAALTAVLEPPTDEMATGWIATATDGTACAVIAMPLTAGNAPAKLDPAAALSVPLAIAHPLRASVRTAVIDLNDAGGVTVIIDRTRMVDVTPLLESIAGQDGVAAVDIVLLGNAPSPPVPDKIAGRVRVGEWPDETGGVVIRVDAAVRLSDPKTLGMLATLLARPDIAAASCAQTTTGRAGLGFGGYSPVSLTLAGRPGVVVREVALPLGTFEPPLPMLALSPRLIATRREAAAGLRDCDGPDAALLFGIRAIEAGRVNLLATEILATTVLAPDLSERVDPISPGELTPERIAALVDRIAVVTPV